MMKIDLQEKKINVPDFLVIGAQRSGTTSLFYMLKQHPQLHLPKIKEPKFFVFVDPEIRNKYKNYVDENVITRIEKYIDLFKRGENKIKGEVSPEYLFFSDITIKNIKKFLSHWNRLKIIVILRNPLTRTISHYRFIRMSAYEDKDFDEAICLERERLEKGLYPMRYGYVSLSLYSKQLKSFLENFKNLKIILFEEFKLNPQKVVKDIYGYLGVDPYFKPRVEHIGVSGNAKSVLSKLILLYMRKESSFSKKVLKILLPYRYRKYIKLKLLRISLKKEQLDDIVANFMNKHSFEVLRDMFLNEINTLQKMLSDRGAKLNLDVWKDHINDIEHIYTR